MIVFLRYLKVLLNWFKVNFLTVMLISLCEEPEGLLTSCFCSVRLLVQSEVPLKMEG